MFGCHPYKGMLYNSQELQTMDPRSQMTEQMQMLRTGGSTEQCMPWHKEPLITFEILFESPLL